MFVKYASSTTGDLMNCYEAVDVLLMLSMTRSTLISVQDDLGRSSGLIEHRIGREQDMRGCLPIDIASRIIIRILTLLYAAPCLFIPYNRPPSQFT